ncbi:dynein axonemal assembly factor 1 homolog [Drosophila gunungcola]|uniref:dynein axonemal assembly factor 1 homolog n=1 Tax=Drosophila gunungcola TaxID=103775 RepID=UPI0022DF2CB7|nr:dynein axonemal assembly factor 1 homolog [Drosophila gunungcola]
MSQGTARREITCLNRITPKKLKDLCKKNKLYQTPRLNDVLYLHYQGYQSIECLEEYTELKCLWLECNAISEIQGLEQLTKLKCLFLQNNLITKIENLEPCRELDTLNLSSNHIRKIQNIGTDILPVLNTLNIASNYLKDSDSLSDLIHCKTLSVLDLSNNRIDDILIVKVFEQMPALKVLVLQGNPVVSRLPQYRKTLILACKELTYLDSRPVFPRDRACAEAWKQDGYEGERRENNRWNRAEHRKTRESVNCTIRMRNSHRPPDQQDPLLRSSDSEDDTCAEKTRKKVELENGAVDDLWDEVSGEQPSSEHSSTSSSSPDENDAAGSQDDHIAEELSSRTRRPLEGRPKCLYENELEPAEETKEMVKEVEPESITANVSEDIIKTKHSDDKEVKNIVCVPIQEAKLEELNIREEHIDKDNRNALVEVCHTEKPQENDETFGNTETQVKTPEQDSKTKAVEIQNIEEDVLDLHKIKLDTELEVKSLEQDKLEELNIREENSDKDKRNALVKDCNTEIPQENDETLGGTVIEVKTPEQDSVNKAAETQNIEDDLDLHNIKLNTETEVKTLEQINVAKTQNVKEGIPNQHSINSNEDFTTQGDSSSELENTEDLEHTCKALTIVANNDELGHDPTSKEIKEKLIEKMYKSFGDDIYENLDDEPLEMLLKGTTTNYHPEEGLCGEDTKTPRDFYQEVEEPSFTPKTKEQLDFELDCAIANDKCAHDLQEMGSQLEEDLEELRQSTALLTGAKKVESVQTDTETETDEEDLTTQQDSKSHFLAQQFDERRKQMKLRDEARAKAKAKAEEESQKDAATDTILKDTVADAGQDQLFAKILDDATDNVPKRIFGSGCDAPSQDWSSEECMRQLTLAEVNDILREDDNVFTQPITNKTSLEEAEEVCLRMDQKLAADEEALRNLLQELEDEVEVKYDIETKVEYEEEIIITTEEPDVADICTSLLDDIIVELTYNEMLLAKKPKSFEFGPIESDEEFSYSAEPQLEKLVRPELEDPARGKSLRECLDVFSDFVNSMADPKLPCLLGRNPSSGVDKIRAAQNLLKSKNLEEINKDTAESMYAQIAKEKERVSRRVAASASRCFNQRDKYEDTLEVVDNKLMVVKKDTGELEELPPPPALISDTESEDYYSAEEVTPGKGDIRRPWTTPYKPKPRKSEEHLVSEAMQQCRIESDSEDSNPDDAKENPPVEDEFHSLEAMTTFGSLDSEFFQKLDLEKVTGNDDAESAIECMRSYKELKACMKAGSMEHQLTSEENEMLQEMLSKDSEQNKPKSNNPQREEEDDLLKKMVQRMKEFEEKERQLKLKPEDDPKELDPIKLSQGGFKVFEISQADVASMENEGDGILETKDSKDDIKVEQVKPSQVEESGDPSIKTPDQIAPKNARIDDDIQSDPSTDYESSEEVVVVEPPKLPEAVLKSFLSDGFEADLKMVHALEEATRRNLYSPNPKRFPQSTVNEDPLPGNDLQEKEQETTLPTDQSSSAKAKWARIAARLPEFLDPETIAMLDKQEFAETDESEDEEDENFITDLITSSVTDTAAIEEEKLGNEEKLVVTEYIGDGNPGQLKANEMKSREEKLISNIGIRNFKGGAGDMATEDTIKEQPTAVEEILTTFSNENEKQASANTPNQNAPTKPFLIDYFEAGEPTVEIENFGDTESLKTEQIQCNLEILSDDGDVVVEEVKVSAQVTFK